MACQERHEVLEKHDIPSKAKPCSCKCCMFYAHFSTKLEQRLLFLEKPITKELSVQDLKKWI
jgi:hypothetical protein